MEDVALYINNKLNGIIKPINSNVIEVSNLPLMTDGFEVYMDNDVLVGDYKAYKTLYRMIDDNTYQYSNNESVYVVEETKYNGDPPTQDDIINIKKSQLVNQSKMELSTYLASNPLVSTCHNDKSGTYSITSDKQSLMTSNYLSYMISKQLGLDTTITWNESGKECEIWTEQEFLTLIAETTAYVKPLVKKQQEYEVAINACTTLEELEMINIAY